MSACAYVVRHPVAVEGQFSLDTLLYSFLFGQYVTLSGPLTDGDFFYRSADVDGGS